MQAFDLSPNIGMCGHLGGSSKLEKKPAVPRLDMSLGAWHRYISMGICAIQNHQNLKEVVRKTANLPLCILNAPSDMWPESPP